MASSQERNPLAQREVNALNTDERIYNKVAQSQEAGLSGEAAIVAQSLQRDFELFGINFSDDAKQRYQLHPFTKLSWCVGK